MSTSMQRGYESEPDYLELLVRVNLSVPEAVAAYQHFLRAWLPLVEPELRPLVLVNYVPCSSA